MVGLTVAQKTKISSSPDADTTFENETAAAQRQIDVLRAQGVNKIVLLSYIGYDLDKQVAAQLSGVDVVVGGDSHTLLGPDALKASGVGNPAGSYPTRLTDKDGKTVCVVQAWEYAQAVGELKVTFDERGDVQSCTGTPHVLIGDNFTIASKAPTAAEHRPAGERWRQPAAFCAARRRRPQPWPCSSLTRSAWPASAKPWWPRRPWSCARAACPAALARWTTAAPARPAMPRAA